MEKSKIKGWCPSLEKPMETGDGLLVRIPIKFGQVNAEIARKIAALSIKYGNGHLDLSARGNLQLRGVQVETYELLRVELARLGFVKDFALNIITSPFDKDAQVMAEELRVRSVECGVSLPEKFLIVIDSDEIFPLSALPCDLYIKLEQADVSQILYTLQNVKKCAKKSANEKAKLPELGFINPDIISIAASFGRIEAEALVKLAAISDEFADGKIIFAPFRRVLLANIAIHKVKSTLYELEMAGFIAGNDDSRLNIHACVGAPACNSALGETRLFAEKWAADFPDLTQIVHITGCSKGCAYKGKADITITATKIGYEITL